MIQIYELATTSGETTLGAWSTTTNRISGALLKHVFIDFGDSACSFDTKLTDSYGRELIHIQSSDTILNETYDLPLRGYYTITVSNVTMTTCAAATTSFMLRFAAQDVF